jgi:hypothetical protein
MVPNTVTASAAGFCWGTDSVPFQTRRNGTESVPYRTARICLARNCLGRFCSGKTSVIEQRVCPLGRAYPMSGGFLPWLDYRHRSPVAISRQYRLPTCAGNGCRTHPKRNSQLTEANPATMIVEVVRPSRGTTTRLSVSFAVTKGGFFCNLRFRKAKP